MLVALVIGHSTESKGAYNKDLNIYEYDLNKKEVEDVYAKLQAQNIKCVIVHRNTYKKLPNDINKFNPNFIVSFHHNRFDETSTGTETLYYHKSAKGKKLAEIMQEKTVNALGYKNRGIKPKSSEDRGGYVLKYTNAPCVILEPCFISNNEEVKDFIEKQDMYTDALVDGIKEYINI